MLTKSQSRRLDDQRCAFVLTSKSSPSHKGLNNTDELLDILQKLNTRYAANVCCFVSVANYILFLSYRMEEQGAMTAPVIEVQEKAHSSTSSATSSSESLVSSSSASSFTQSTSFIQPTNDEEFFDMLMTIQVRWHTHIPCRANIVIKLPLLITLWTRQIECPSIEDNFNACYLFIVIKNWRPAITRSLHIAAGSTFVSMIRGVLSHVNKRQTI